MVIPYNYDITILSNIHLNNLQGISREYHWNSSTSNLETWHHRQQAKAPLRPNKESVPAHLVFLRFKPD